MQAALSYILRTIARKTINCRLIFFNINYIYIYIYIRSIWINIWEARKEKNCQCKRIDCSLHLAGNRFCVFFIAQPCLRWGSVERGKKQRRPLKIMISDIHLQFCIHSQSEKRLLALNCAVLYNVSVNGRMWMTIQPDLYNYYSISGLVRACEREREREREGERKKERDSAKMYASEYRDENMCGCMYMPIYVHACMHVLVCMCAVSVHQCACVYMFNVCMYICMCINLCTSVCCLCIHVHLCGWMSVYICMCACTCMCMCAYV